ncbi:MAG: DUF6428 family protein [Verrucomicrobiales bacterium]
MTTRETLKHLQSHPNHLLSFAIPDGSRVPAHFHITEVGYVAKSFIDCGVKRHTMDSCVLQAWVADDMHHRLKASKLPTIFGRADGLLPNLDLPVAIEVEAPVLT